jgi:uncharacterized protein (UPF0276 family)
LNLVTDATFVSAVKPLFADRLVDAIEWDVDSPWVLAQAPIMPSWIERLLDLYAAEGRLYGHCVWLSVLSAQPQARQRRWLERLAQECARRPYRLLSEHLGFMSAGPFVINTTLPSPYVTAAVDVGRDTLGRLAEAAGSPVGLENMAAALAPADATAQAALLDDILSAVDGYVVLDLHNVFAQASNLGLDPMVLLVTLASERVREIHVSGGRWVDIEGRPYRFDGHNDPVPADVFALLKAALSLCREVSVVILERRGGTLRSDADVDGLRADYRHLVEIVREADASDERSRPMTPLRSFKPPVASDMIRVPEELARYQDALVEVLASTGTSQQLQARLLAHHAVAPVQDYVASFLPRCIAATSMLVRRWAKTAVEFAAHGVVPNIR